MENNSLIANNANLENLPESISNTLTEVSKFDARIKSSRQKAVEAKKSAGIAHGKDAGWSFFGGNKKEAIEALQEALVAQANAVENIVDAQEDVFENQKRMAKAMMNLFALGVSNIAANRTIVKQLEMKLNNASENELNEFARQEIAHVVMQLKAQEDLNNRIDRIENTMYEHWEQIKANSGIIQQMENELGACEQLIRQNENIDANKKAFFDLLWVKVLVSVSAIASLALNIFLLCL